MTKSESEIERGVYQTPSNDDDLYDDYDDEEGMGRGPVFAIFAVIVLAAFVGVVWLAYQQGVRTGQGNPPPTITASDDPFKVEPTDPEGMAEPEESLTAEMLAGAELNDQPTTVTSSTEQPIENARPSNDTAGEGTPTLRSSDLGINDSGTSGGQLAVPPPSTTVQGADTSAEAEVESVEVAGNDAPREAESAVADSDPVTGSGVETASEPATTSTSGLGALFDRDGAYVVQVASVPERADADGAWSRLNSRHSTIVQGYAQDVQAVDLGDRGIWYRLRVGYFADSDDAGVLCGQLQDAGQDCLVASR